MAAGDVMTTVTHNPATSTSVFDAFSFNPKNMMEFLFDSLKPDYASNVKDSFVMGNVSNYLVGFIKQVFPDETAQRLVDSRLGQEVMNVIDTEMGNLFRGMNTKNATVQEMLETLMKFDMSKMVAAAATQSLWNVQSLLPTDFKIRLSEIISKLENDVSIASDLQIVIANVSGIEADDIAIQLDKALRDQTKLLKRNSSWAGESDLQKLRLLLMNFNYRTFGEDFVQSQLSKVHGLMSAGMKNLLEDFIKKLNDSQPLKMAETLPQGLLTVYDFLRDTLNMTFLPPFTSNMSFEALEFLGVFDAVEEALNKTMTQINTDKDLSSRWSDIHGVSNTERLVMVLRLVDYAAIGQGIMGNIIEIIDDDMKLNLLMRVLVMQSVDAVSLTTGSEMLVNETADILAQTFHESLMKQKQHANWTKLTNSERLGRVIREADWGRTLKLLAVVATKQQELSLSSTELQDIREMLALVQSGNVTEVHRTLTIQFDKVFDQLWNGTISADIGDLRDDVLENISHQLIETHQVIMNGNETAATPIFKQFNSTYTQLSDLEKLVYISMSVNYTEIGEIISQHLDNILERTAGDVLDTLKRKDSIIPAFKDFISSVKRLSILSTNVTNWIDNIISSPPMNKVLESIDSQMLVAYEGVSSSWTVNFSNREKLMDLLKHYDYAATGDVIILDLLARMDSMLPASANSLISDFIDKVEQKKSLFDVLKTLWTTVQKNYPIMEQLSFDVLMPVSDYLDQCVQDLSKEELELWKSTPGKLPKVYIFLRSINYTQLYEMTSSAVGMRMLVNSLLGQAAATVPDAYRKGMVGLMNVMESGNLSEAIIDTLLDRGDNYMIRCMVK
ncbi:uncharacterized protein [Watersipora subatra]|uniref:uncharacterized protein n=1 Tax=Watersipora subatra TaxID=2589382 RepID=UPI00355BEFFA